MSTKENTTYDVVIIGSGISGIKAASHLFNNGITNIKVLEARDRVGGRLHSVPGLNHDRYDLGASWHHDLLINPLFKEELQLKKTGLNTPFVYEDDLPAIFNNDGERLDDNSKYRLEPILDELSTFIEIKNENVEQNGNAKDTSLYSSVIDYLGKYKETLTDKQIEYVYGTARFAELWHGISWKKISSLESVGGHYGRNALIDGHKGIVDRIVSLEFPIKTFYTDEICELDVQVTKIKKTQSEKKLIKIEYLQKNKVKKGIKAKYCIVTVPLSLLKASVNASEHNDKGTIKFEPPFNFNLTSALNKIHYGALGKVFFEFDKCSWSTEKSRVLYIGNTSLRTVEKIKSNKIGDKDSQIESVQNSLDHPFFFVNLARNLGVPTILMLTSQPVTNHMESFRNDVTKLYNYFKPVLENLFKALGAEKPPVYCPDATSVADDGVSVLKNVITTSWTLDPYARGAYTVSNPGDDLENFVKTITLGHEKTIRFAGEHTMVEGNGCAWAAWASGIREADFVINDLNKPLGKL
ncbi:flavin monoamine oxidase family protein SCDLUD_004185 [Saccharomycodes ludwigii]|uniref:flavin monoamine oxidase family protein n=1 Tax=Saccharomycodes ludwigii TaxID=36035 RepID=UPI001E8785D4|nr:hypothetical protein SCDLUD_004185 [Saccharomycodes ludwigii]KAH3899884.1 hypothetical protein SCDLUD_004185 [Saccharomycodes ludwigii]